MPIYKKLCPLFIAMFSISSFYFPLSFTKQPALALSSSTNKTHTDPRDYVSSGCLRVTSPVGKKNTASCPLKHTDVKASVSGHVAKVKVKQQFTNPYSRSVEAVYTFPLPQDSAVDHMVMTVGSRKIVGLIKKRNQAKRIYQQAKQKGKTAALLNQERTNIFTQAVANIPPKGTVEIEIEYVQLVKFEKGKYSFVFPMVVGPRYIPGHKKTVKGTGWSFDTNRVKDASLITPPVVRDNRRAGHDISLSLSIDAGMPILESDSKLHRVMKNKVGDKRLNVTLVSGEQIPNRDFVFDWKVGGDNVKEGFLTHKIGKEGYFALSILPPSRPISNQINPKEVVFVIDKSGSQSGLPLQKAKETVLYSLDKLNDNDTFQILTFSNKSEKLFAQPVKVSYSSLSTAKKFVSKIRAHGGTQMKEAIERAARFAAPARRLRVFVLMTDGYIGNETEVVGLVKRTRKLSRWFPFGTGNSINRSLIHSIATNGGGEPEFVLLNRSGKEVAKSFYDKISSPVLTDVKLQFSGVNVKEVFPVDLCDVWAQKPLYIMGKYTGSGTGSVIMTGNCAGKPYRRVLFLEFPSAQKDNSVLTSVWARTKVAQLMNEINYGMGNSRTKLNLEKSVENLGLNFGLLTKYTSFVAVDQSGVRYPDSGTTTVVPVEAPDGYIQHRSLNSASFSAPRSTRTRARSRVRTNRRIVPRAHRQSYKSNATIRNYSRSFYSSGGNAARFNYQPNVWRKPTNRSVHGNVFGRPVPTRKQFHRVQPGFIPKQNLIKVRPAKPLIDDVVGDESKIIAAENKLSSSLKRSLDAMSVNEKLQRIKVKVQLRKSQHLSATALSMIGAKMLQSFEDHLVVEISYDNLMKLALLKEVLKITEVE